MRCPACKHSYTKVVDSRELDFGQCVRRRRECEQCAERLTTYERAPGPPPPPKTERELLAHLVERMGALEERFAELSALLVSRA